MKVYVLYACIKESGTFGPAQYNLVDIYEVKEKARERLEFEEGVARKRRMWDPECADSFVIQEREVL